MVALIKTAFPLVVALGAICSVAKAQDGLISDDFSTGSQYGWENNSRAFARVENGKLVVAMTKQTSGLYRGDMKRDTQTTLHAGAYPIIAVKMSKPPDCQFTFDTQLGSYNGASNYAEKIETPAGNVYFWDLSQASLGTTTLSTTNPTTVSFIQFKVANVVLTQAQLDANDTLYDVDWVRSFPSEAALRLFLDPAWTGKPSFTHVGAFRHPGLLHDSADIARLKRYIDSPGSLPYSGYQKFIANGKSSSDYVMQGPFISITRDSIIPADTTVHNVNAKIESDVLAAYYTAVQWAATGDKAYARKAIEILNGYATKTTSISGSGPELNGLYGFLLANAAELMAHTPSGWTPQEITACKNMLKNVFYPVLQNFKPCAHGNWDIICMKCLMAIAIFCDDQDMYNRVVNYFYDGEGNGPIYHYIVNESGQLEESNRDQGHSQLALGCLSELAEMAWKQGDDLYGANDNGIMRGYEYTAKYNLGNDVPYSLSYDYCEIDYPDYTPESISSKSRGNFRAVYEIAYNHYVVLKKMSMPWTAQVLSQIRPEGAPNGSDNPGYGTFLFYRDQDSTSAIHAAGSPLRVGFKVFGGIVTLTDVPIGAEVSVVDQQGKYLYRVVNLKTGTLRLPKQTGVAYIAVKKAGQRRLFKMDPIPN